MINLYLENFNILYFSNFVIGSIASFLFVYPINYFGIKYALIDRLDSRKEYRDKIVRIGGLSIVLSFFLSIILYQLINNVFSDNQLIYLLFYSTLFFFIGFFDDILAIKAIPRLILQISISFAAWFFCSDLQFKFLDKVFTQNYLFDINLILGIFITVIWISGVTNAINWTDGLDGLASGISIVVLIGLFFIFLTLDQYQYAFYSISLAGCCYGFFLQNYKPAKIIMGDGGAYFLGFNLASLCLIASNKIMTLYPLNIYNVFLPFLLLTIPILDMLVVILTRILNSRSPFQPDRNHLHHKLLKNGYSYQKTLRIIIFLNLIFSFMTLLIFKSYSHILISTIIIFILNFFNKIKSFNFRKRF